MVSRINRVLKISYFKFKKQEGLLTFFEESFVYGVLRPIFT